MNLCEKVTCITHGIKLIKLCLMLTFIVVFLEQQNQFDSRPRRIHAEAEPDSRWLHQSCNTITDDKEFVVSDSSSSPEFIQELLPSAKRTVLLYHLTYLYLRDFPELEPVIRKRAVETQLLFRSSEALLEKCAGTSENFVTSLLPNLKVTLEKNKPEFALKHLEKAKGWISDIIMDVEEIVKRYNEHSDVAATTRDIITEKQQNQTHEMEELQKIIDGLEQKHLNISKKIEDYEKKIEEKNTEMYKFISNITGTDFNIYSKILPFVKSIISRIFKTIESTSEDSIQLRALYADLSEITKAQKRLIEDEWNIQVKLMENELKMDKLQTENGQLSSFTHLDEVQKSLSQTQRILVQLQKFWEKVGYLLDTLKEKTIAGNVLIDDLTDMKEEFLKSIDVAEEGWTKFGISCSKANKIFSIQTNQAYRFLEINPSSLSEEEWQNEYESVKEKLENIKPNTVCPTPQEHSPETRV